MVNDPETVGVELSIRDDVRSSLPLICLQCSRSVSKMQNTTQNQSKALQLSSIGLSGSESVRQRFYGLLKVSDVE